MPTTTGIVIEHRKNNYLVDTGTGVREATPRGCINRRPDRPRVGDRVSIECPPSHAGKGIITEVHPRRNLLSRPAIANVDQSILITTICEPAVTSDILDRFLFNAEVAEIDVSIVFNKDDLLTTPNLRDTRDALLQIYRCAGYTCIATSAFLPQSCAAVLSLCQSKISTFAGVSGVGKSSILNHLLPGIELRTGELSRGIDRGIHTTTSALLIALPQGGYIADTPGFAWIDVPYVAQDQVALFFPELRKVIGTCRFNNCQHGDEPGCAILQQVESGTLAPSRHRSYRTILEEMRCHRSRYRRSNQRD